MKTYSHNVEGDLNTDRAKQQSAEDPRRNESPVLRRDDHVFLHQGLSTPCLDEVVEASGGELTLRGGRRLLDFHGNGVHNLGFGHPRVLEVVQKQMAKLPFCTRRYTHETAVKAAERVVDATGQELSRVLFAPAGTLAVSSAIRLAKIATQKSRIVTMDGSFHGASLDVAAVAGQASFREQVDPATPEPLCVAPPPHAAEQETLDEQTASALSSIEHHLRRGDVAAVLSEPIRWTTAQVPHPSFWQSVRRLCDDHGALLIFDEIGAGLGRTGRMFAYQHVGVTPDMLCLGKSLGGGVVPIAAVAATERLNVAGRLSPGHYTHEKSPAGCAAAATVFEVLKDEELVDRAAKLGRVALERLHAWAQKRDVVAEVRGVGLLIAIELRDDADQSAESLALRAMQRALETGVNFKVTSGRVLTLTPALTIPQNDLIAGLDTICQAVDSVVGVPVFQI